METLATLNEIGKLRSYLSEKSDRTHGIGDISALGVANKCCQSMEPITEEEALQLVDYFAEFAEYSATNLQVVSRSNS